MKQYGVLIVDDSSFMRKSISNIIEKESQFFVIGIARNGIDAVEKIKRLKPDLVTMDIDMPEMDGLRSLKQIMQECPVPVVMLSNFIEEGAEATLEALELGAVDFYLKTTLIGDNIEEGSITSFLTSLKVIAENSAHIQECEANKPSYETENELPKTKISKAQLLVIGCSTGGPSALQSVLPRFPMDYPIPIIVIQHMPEGFTGPLAERFNSICKLGVKEGKNGERLIPGNIYIAPAGYQLTFKQKEDEIFLKISRISLMDSMYSPSVNDTLCSAASIYKEKLIAVVMTGMGNDGLIGCEQVKKQGGKVIVESEETCVVYGMPKVIKDAGIADRQVNLSSIYQTITEEM